MKISPEIKQEIKLARRNFNRTLDFMKKIEFKNTCVLRKNGK